MAYPCGKLIVDSSLNDLAEADRRLNDGKITSLHSLLEHCLCCAVFIMNYSDLLRIDVVMSMN